MGLRNKEGINLTMTTLILDLQPVLIGKNIHIRPLSADDYNSLYQVASDPLIWEQHPSPLRYQRDKFDTQIFHSGLASKSTLVAIDNETSQIIGSSRYYDVDDEKRELAIGFTFLARSYWGGYANKEIKSLMLNHAFTWANRVWFHAGINNIRSCKALEKIGATLSHNEPRHSNGELINHCYYFINP